MFPPGIITGSPSIKEGGKKRNISRGQRDFEDFFTAHPSVLLKRRYVSLLRLEINRSILRDFAFFSLLISEHEPILHARL